MFGNPNAASQAGLALLKQIQGMQGNGGALASGSDGTPNFINNGLIGRLMSGNPGGVLGALLKPSNAPVNPGSAPAAGSPMYVPGGAGPMAGGAPMAGPQLTDLFKGGGMGLLGKLPGFFGGG